MLNLPAHIAPPVISNARQLPPRLFSVAGPFQFSIPSGVSVCHLGVTHLLFLSAHDLTSLYLRLCLYLQFGLFLS